jgi:glycosyltransferase involved in cell wall biosynthesis
VAPPWLTVPPQGYGGTERVVALLADGLVANGHDVTLFAANGSRTTARLVSPLAVAPPIIGSAPDDEVFHTLSAFLAHDEFDVIHDHTGLGPAFGAFLLGGPPVVHTLHGPWTPAVRRKLGLVHDRAHLVAISHAQRRANPDVRYAGVVHNGVDLDAHPCCETKEDFLVFLGRISPEKAPEVAVEVARRAGLPLTMIVKRSEPAEWEYWEQVVAPHLDDNVTVIEQPPHEVKGRHARPSPGEPLSDHLARTVRPRTRRVVGLRHAGDHPPAGRRARDRDPRSDGLRVRQHRGDG